MEDVSYCSDDVEVEELYGIEDFSDLEDEVFLPGDAWLPPLTVDVDQYDADDEEPATSMMMDQPLATFAMMMSPPASPTTMDEPPPPLATLALMMPLLASPTPTPPIDIPTRSSMPVAGPYRSIYSPITPSPPPPMVSPTLPSMLAGPPRYWPIYSPITPPVVPPMMSSGPSPTLSEVLTTVSRVLPTMSQILAADARKGPPTLEMLRAMLPQTIAPRVGGQYYSAITDDEDDGAATGMKILMLSV